VEVVKVVKVVEVVEVVEVVAVSEGFLLAMTLPRRPRRP